MKRLFCGVMVAAAFVMAGCVTEQTRRIVDGEDTETTSGLSEEDLRRIVKGALDSMRNASKRFIAKQYQARGEAVPATLPRRVVNVKPFTIDTMARGSQIGYLADALKTMFEEEMMGEEDPNSSVQSGIFVPYNEAFAAQTGVATVRPEFVLTGKLREQNVRRDNGNFYKENSLHLRLTDVATGLDFWQKRVPLRKAVDRRNVMN